MHAIACKCICWLVHGRIKAKISVLYAIKCQACCIANTVQWLTKQYSYFNYSACKQPSLMIHARHIWLVFRAA